MRRTIVLEGPDGAGKSTLAATLSLATGRPVLHTGGPNYTLEGLQAKLTQIETEALDNPIFDRVCHISQFIYEGPPINDQEHLMTQDEMTERMVNTYNPIVIYCRLQSVEDMLVSITTNWKPHKPPEYLEKVKVGFPTIVRRYDETVVGLIGRRMDVLRWDWKGMPLQLLLNNIRMIEEGY